jgi:hypothetical protein
MDFDDVIQKNGVTPGDLNYLITNLIHAHIEFHGTSYLVFNEVMGVLECAKMELYRRHVAPYEDTKIEQNGDVPEVKVVADGK